jgi:1-pyrroline-5-carboxylate dehydrogenase
MSTTTERVTYATLAAGQSEAFKKKYDEALLRVRASFGARHPSVIGGQEHWSAQTFEDRSPVDSRIVMGTFPVSTKEDVDRAVSAARGAFPAWGGRPWRERTSILRKAADLIEERGFELSALVSLEAGKNRLEAMGDVTETADLIRYYCQQMEHNDGFDHPMSRLTPQEETRSTLRPYGVWVVISPFNFPAALAGGPMGGALVAGNTVILKPSHETPLTGLALHDVFRDAGVPAGAVNIVFGTGSLTGAALTAHPGVDGMLFTGSKAVGMSLLHSFSKDYPKPCITEMGGKNPAIVMPSADLDAAAEGVMRSAFGLQGQKCSACSRVYVHSAVKDRFTELLLEKTARLTVGDPSQDGVFLGPVIHERAFQNYERYAAMARKDGKVLTGGRSLREGELAHGWFVAPTIVDGLPKDHVLFSEEMFVPIVCLASISSLDEALTLANRTEYGLTAGFFGKEEAEIQQFLDNAEAGVVYVNRRAGATTGAWPGVQPFGGWKASGSSGKASGGLYYVQQFMREQSRTIVR